MLVTHEEAEVAAAKVAMPRQRDRTNKEQPGSVKAEPRDIHFGIQRLAIEQMGDQVLGAPWGHENTT